jgi:radical SAM protein with 4Fe4S-binding SPASM domain
MLAITAIGRFAGTITATAMDVLRRPFPPTVRIETTNHCNAACSFCPRESIGRSKTFMDDELYEKIVRECGENKVKVLHVHNFGEPLLDKKLPARVTFAKEQGIAHVKIFCNGALLRGDIAERLLTSGLDEIKISLDGANSQEFNELRIGLNHQQVVENTRNFRKLRDERGIGPKITAACTVSSSKEETEKLLEGVVDKIDWARLHNWAGGRKLLGNEKVRRPCDRLWRTMTILVNGDVALCCLDYSGKEILGNVRETTLKEIWNNPRYRELRHLHRTSQQEKIALCNNCTKSYY